MKKILLTTVAAAALSASAFALAAAPAQVNSQVQPVVSAKNNGGAYVGIQAGIGGLDTKKLSSNDLSGVGYKEELRHGISGRVYGGYLFSITNQFSVGAELGYAMYPNNKYTFGNPDLIGKEEFKGHYFDLLGAVKYNITDNFNVFGKLGGAYVTQKSTYKSAPSDVSGVLEDWSVTKNKLLPETAIGVGYNFTQNFAIDLTYAHVFGDTVDANKARENEDTFKDMKVASIDTVMLGAAYRF